MRTLVIIRGVPGAGKTSLAQLLAALPRSVSVAADDYPGRYSLVGAGDHRFHEELNAAAHAWCLERVRDYLEMGCSVVAVHNTFVRAEEVVRYADLGDEYGYRVIVLEVQGRHGSVHRVPEEVVSSMAEAMEPWPPEVAETIKRR